MAYGNLNVDTITGSGASSVIVNNGSANVCGFTTGNNLQMLQNGGGIVFSNSSATTNSTLNDYETGTWTPILTRDGTAPSLSYSTQVGSYTKIGRLVTVGIDLTISAISSQGSGYWQIGNLPFTVNTLVNYRTAGSIGLSGQALTGIYPVNNQTFAYLVNAGALINPSISTIQLMVGVTYEATF